MHGIVLAAGRGSRLEGLAAPYHKPLLVVNGKPLITQAVEAAREICDLITVVVSPENAVPICAVLAANIRDLRFVIQPSATGPGDAVRLARQGLNDESLLIICADNIIAPGLVTDMFSDVVYGSYSANVVVCAKVVDDRDEAMRYAYIVGGEIFEGHTPEFETQHKWTCWLGPVIVHEMLCVRFISELCQPQLGEIKLARAFNVGNIDTFIPEQACYDIGVPEALA